MFLSLLKHTGIKGHGHCPAYDNAASCGNRSGSFKTLTIHRWSKGPALVPHPPHKTVEVGPTGAVQQGDLPPTKIIGNTDRCKSSDSISMAGNSASGPDIQAPASGLQPREQGGADLAA